MRVSYKRYAPGADIPVRDVLQQRKAAKYFNRETAAAMVCLAQLLQGERLPESTPFYYAKGAVEYEDIGLPALVRASRDHSGKFSSAAFVSEGMAAISPLTQFKVLYNMPLSFIAIEHRLTGDNAVLYGSAAALLLQADHAPGDPVLLGADRVDKEGWVSVGFALLSGRELATLPRNVPGDEAVDLFRLWSEERGL